MNDQELNNKTNQDSVKFNKDLSNLFGDKVGQLHKFEDNLGVAGKEFTRWADDGVIQLSKEFEKLKCNARKSIESTSETMKKEVGHGLSQYDVKVQEFADRVPGDFSKKAARYPWVTISIFLAFGFLMGSLLRPGRQL